MASAASSLASLWSKVNRGGTLKEMHLSRTCLLVMQHTGPCVVVNEPPGPADVHPKTTRRLTGDELRVLARLTSRPSEPTDELLDGHPDFRAFLASNGLLVQSEPPLADTPTPLEDPPATFAPVGEVRLRLGAVFTVGDGAIQHHDHFGRLLATFSPEEFLAASSFVEPSPISDHDPAVVDKLTRANLLISADINQGADFRTTLAQGFQRSQAIRQASLEMHVAHDQAHNSGAPRIPIVPVHLSAGGVPPLSVAMLLTFAEAWNNGVLNETFDFYPRWLSATQDIGSFRTPSVYLFSNYLWSHIENLEASAQVKAADPNAITIHGGPDCPGYRDDTEVYLTNNPHVDIAVHGEGEQTFAEILAALAPSMQEGAPDLRALATVAGITYRDGQTLVRTGPRERLSDLDAVPSPYLAGTFECFAASEMPMAIIETNRGCPYGCTFCDWGSATNSRIRKFDLDRVKAELTWCAQNKVERIFVADANFGIFARDVELAQHVADLKVEYGYPHRLITNYAKNTVKHLKEIVSIISSAGILTEGLLSLQSMDDATLAAIRRHNIKLEKYDAMATEFSHAHLPLFVDLMMGLPGQTVESFLADLQQCVDRDVTAKVHATELLVNSPMNEPEYRSEFEIVASRPPGPAVDADGKPRRKPSLVVQSSSFSREDFDTMDRIRRAFMFGENLGVARIVARFVRQETGLSEVAFIDQLRRLGLAEPEHWPALFCTFSSATNVLVAPGNWLAYIDELRRVLINELELANNPALNDVLTVQHLLLPTPGRAFPASTTLNHDVAAWYHTILEVKQNGDRRDWPEKAPRLDTFGAAGFTVDDPNNVCTTAMGRGSAIDAYRDWELGSAVARALPAHHTISS